MSDELKKPEEVFNGDNLPEDLKWLMSHFGLPKNDPTVVLLAWHWQRVQNHNDAIQNSILMLKAALDTRIEKIESCASTVTTMTGTLEELSLVLSQKPLLISQQIEGELKTPIAASVQACSTLASRLSALLNYTNTTLQTTSRRQMWACFVSGLVIGSMLIPWTYMLFFSAR